MGSSDAYLAATAAVAAGAAIGAAIALAGAACVGRDGGRVHASGISSSDASYPSKPTQERQPSTPEPCQHEVSSDEDATQRQAAEHPRRRPHQHQQQHHQPPRAPARSQRRRHPASGDACCGDQDRGCSGGGGGSNRGEFATSIDLVSPVDAKKRSDPYDCRPRSGYLQWDDYFMSVAFLSAQRSKDPNKQVGAVIVSPDNIILSIGYNGFPRGCPDERLPWSKKSRSGNVLDTKYPYVVHAEANALLNKNQASVAGTRVFVTMFPCNECAKLLIQAGIQEVVYHESKVESVQHHPALTAPLNGDGCSDSSSGDGSGDGSGGPAGGDAAAAAGAARRAAGAHGGDEALEEEAFAFPTLGGGGGGGNGANSGRRSSSSGGGGGGGGAAAAHVAVGAPDAGYVASRRLLTMAGVHLRQHKLRGLIVVNPSC